MFKMIEAQLMTKIGEAEQAVLALANNYFRFNTINYEQFQIASSNNIDNPQKVAPNTQDTIATIECPFDSIINLEDKVGAPTVYANEIEGSFLNHNWCLYKALKY